MTRDDFEHWLFIMDDELTALFNLLPSDFTAKLDYSIESLIELESWILNRFDSLESVTAPENMLVLDYLSRYVGEVIRRTVGGKWDIELDDVDDAFYRLPVLVHEKYGRECPVTLVSASVDRRKGDYIYKVANVNKRRALA